MQMKEYAKDVNFASVKDPVEFASQLRNKIDTYRKWAGGAGLMHLWRKMFVNYYGMSASGNSSQSILMNGAEGELSFIKINELRVLLQQQLVTITNQRPAGIAKAINADSQSLKASRIGSAIAEYYLSEVNFEKIFVNAAEYAIVLSEGWLELVWDKDAGDIIAVDPDTSQPEMSGDIKARVHAPWNVARDVGANVNDQPWHVCSYKVNKFELAARYPRFYDKIVQVTEDTCVKVEMNTIPDGSDEIYVHQFMHKRTPSLPNGRYALLVGDFIVLDTELPFKDYPLDLITPAEVMDGITGYTSGFDMLAAQAVQDALNSIITTNQISFGGQSIVGPEGSNLNWTDLAKGVRYFELPPDLVDKLRPLEMVRTAPEIFNYIQNLSGKMQQMVGNVSNTLGAQAVQGASGSAMALIQAQSIEFNSGLQRSYYRLLSSVMTKLIFILAKYADTPRVAKMIGKVKSQGLKEFKYTGQDLNSISTIQFELANPVSQTQGGRLAMAQDLLKAGMIKDPKQYITLVTTGSMDSFYENDAMDAALPLEENEMLLDGIEVQALITENHEEHIKNHQSVLSSMKSKEKPEIINCVVQHIQDHINLWQQASVSNPAILMATGQKVLPQAAPPQGPMGPQPSAPHGPDKIQGDGAPPAMHKADEVAPPKMPINPLTHERVEGPQV